MGIRWEQRREKQGMFDRKEKAEGEKEERPRNNSGRII